jgi:hypothetical protein
VGCIARADIDDGTKTAATSTACSAALPFWDATKYANLDLHWDNVAAAAALLLRDTGAGGATYAASYDDFISRIITRSASERNACDPVCRTTSCRAAQATRAYRGAYCRCQMPRV